VTATAIISEKD